MTDPRPISQIRCQLGEGPIWHRDRNRLYWTDIDGRAVYSHDASTGSTERVHAGLRVGGMTIQADGDLLLFGDGGAVSLLTAEGAIRPLVASIRGEETARFNDVVADPAGRVFCGTMSLVGGLGTLYRLDLDGSFERVVEGVGCSNGMGFSPDRRLMYFVDSPTGRIDAFDYDEPGGTIENRRPFAIVDSEEGSPDGMTVDSEGCIWAAVWDGYGVVRFDRDGKRMRKIDVPARNVTSIAFGGANLRTCFVTSAGADLEGEPHGMTFAFDAGVAGLPEFLSRIHVG